MPKRLPRERRDRLPLRGVELIMTRKRQPKSRRTLRQKIAFAALITTTALVTMGASCALGGSGAPLWEVPSAPCYKYGAVRDAHNQAGEDIGTGTEAVSASGSEFVRGRECADNPPLEL